MTDSNYSGNVDINIDPEYADYLADEAEQAQDEYEQARDAQEQSQSTLQQEERVSKEVQDDPRNADNWGAKALIKEGQSILSGGIQDTASSLATFPERTIDALSGDMQRAQIDAEDLANVIGTNLLKAVGVDFAATFSDARGAISDFGGALTTIGAQGGTEVLSAMGDFFGGGFVLLQP